MEINTDSIKTFEQKVGAILLKIAVCSLFIFIGILACKMCNGCEHNTQTLTTDTKLKTTIDSARKADKATELLQPKVVAKIDSIALLTNKLKIANAKLYKSGRVTIVNNPCDTDSALSAYDSLYYATQSRSLHDSIAIDAWRYLDSLKQNRLDSRGIENKALNSLVEVVNHRNDSLRNIALPNEFKRGKRIGRLQGGIVTAVVSTIIYGSVIGR